MDCGQRERSKSHKCTKDAKYRDVLNIGEEVASLHVESRSEDYWRQTYKKEGVVTEFKEIDELLIIMHIAHE